MKIKIKNNVYWTGKIDWELQKFHGDEYSTFQGSTYNSYLIKEEKIALIDTVWAPFAEEFVRNLAEKTDLNKIDYIIANHAEIDHSGALPELMRHIPDTPIYCTKNGLSSFKGQFHKDWNFNVVKTGDRLNLGTKDLIFVEAPMLHWPDSMMTYLTQDNILFSNDAFGQHYASEFMFNDRVDQNALFKEAVKYYANILTPFSPLVTRKINEFLSLNLPLDIICPSHGVIWRDKPVQIVEQYLKWADNYQENQITVIYDSMWENTRKMAEHIAKGIRDENETIEVKLYNAAKSDKNEIITEIFRSKAILMGSSTINQGILTSIAGLVEELKGLKFKNKKAGAFGSYGWSGESSKIISLKLKEAGFDVLDEGIKVKWTPDTQGIEDCREYGKKFAKTLKLLI